MKSNLSLLALMLATCLNPSVSTAAEPTPMPKIDKPQEVNKQESNEPTIKSSLSIGFFDNIYVLSGAQQGTNSIMVINGMTGIIGQNYSASLRGNFNKDLGNHEVTEESIGGIFVYKMDDAYAFISFDNKSFPDKGTGFNFIDAGYGQRFGETQIGLVARYLIEGINQKDGWLYSFSIKNPSIFNFNLAGKKCHLGGGWQYTILNGFNNDFNGLGYTLANADFSMEMKKGLSISLSGGNFHANAPHLTSGNTFGGTVKYEWKTR